MAANTVQRSTPLLFDLKTASNRISLVPNARQLIAEASEPQRKDSAIVGLKVIDTTKHRLAGLDKFERSGYSIGPSGKLLFFSRNKARKKSESLILISLREIRGRCAGSYNFFSDFQVSIQAVAKYELQRSIGLRNYAPLCGRQFNHKIYLLISVYLLRSGRRAA
jgi:hypothetical protein